MLRTNRPYKNITDLNSEMKNVSDGFQSISNNMIAIGMDYKYYLDSSYTNNKIYEFRDNILYRLGAIRLHINIVVNLLSSLDKELSDIFKEENSQTSLHLHFQNRKSDISALFDSIIFHIISAFDYVSNLVAFLSLKNHKKLKWNELAQSVRDPKNELYESTFSKLIDNLDRIFVGRLYKYRSDVIHSGKDGEKSSLSIKLINGKVETTILASSKFNKNFSELKKLNREYDLSISYILFWLLEQTIESIIDIQFGLKEFMEKNKRNDQPLMFMKGPNNEMLPVSTNYWSENNYN
ncbi:hypothetical protein [Dokdonia sp. 4H-3-7-5]|uniref:hypothetical protein n=1 Tax=Dokdonia sp. (strain 4H-3-7-5) TaxID=983548 RepID=UPI00020A7920|nr:hypothetical protein [Dokdonia sp. 4H-3-7-5]AEE20950.1 hypothetical protein Krodi_2976 [Dokdonia sp. 4H-3-7-5]